jgi:protein O-mannosyl-transferase
MAKKQQIAEKSVKITASTPIDSWVHWYQWLPVAAAFVLTSITLGYPLLGLDDHASTTENPIVKDFFNPEHWKKFNLGMYAPVTWWAYSIAYGLSGGKDAGMWYHLLSVLVHTLNTALVIMVLMRLEVGAAVRWVVALLFAVHPIQAESVAWVAGFSTPFYVFFCLASMYAYLRYAHEEDARKWYWAALGLFLLAGLAKSAAVALPPTLMILDWWRSPARLSLQQRLLGYVPFFALAVGFGLLTIYARNTSGTTVGAASDFSALDRFLMVCYTPVFYLSKHVWPMSLNVYYSFNKVNGAFPWYYYAAPVVIATLAVWAWYQRRVARYVWIGLLFYLANVFVTLPFATLGEFELCADHYNYLACVGVFWILVRGWQDMQARWPGSAGIIKAVGYMWLGAMVFLGFWQVRYWKDTITIISHAIDNGYYHNGMMYFGRGIEYGDLNKPQLAIQDFTKALELDSTRRDAYKFRGSLYAQTGRIDLGIKDLEKYVTLAPDDVVTWNNLYEIYNRLNRNDAALNAINKTIALKPDVAGSYQKRAILLQKMNQPEAAQADMEKAKELAQKR